MLIAIAVVGIAIVVVLGIAARKPDDFVVQRSRQIPAPAQRIYSLIEDFHAWQRWSPYEKKDPAMQRTLSGAASGQGAIYAWSGNGNVGQGRMEILEASPPSRILIKLDFFKPFEAHNTAEFTMSPQGNATNVDWVMRGPAPFMFKVMEVFISCDKMIGKDFETGLANLKTPVEK